MASTARNSSGRQKRCIRSAGKFLNEQAARIYLDNAATSWPKPRSVVEAIADFYANHGSAAGRSVASDPVLVDRKVQQVRSRLANLIGANDPNQVAFTFNGTDSLNIAIRGVLRPGDHAITSVLEHNSVLRPLHYLEETGVIKLTKIGIDSNGQMDVGQLEDAITNDTKMICVSHVSNVLGTIQPVEKIGSLEKPPKCLFLVDGAQSVGHIPVDVNAIGCDFFASSGHKGLLGPLGTGFLYANDRAIEQTEPFRLGGTGTASEQTQQPTEMPFRLESGNLNVGGILGLGAALEFITTETVASIKSNTNELIERFLAFAENHDGIRVYSRARNDGGAGVVSLQIEKMLPADVANVLDSQFGIQVRSGLHCSPLVHKSIGSDKLEGTVRISVGHFNTIADIDALTDALTQLASV